MMRQSKRKGIPRTVDADVAVVEVVQANIRAAATIYAASKLEQLGMFAVTDRIVELFTQGLLPLGSGQAGKILELYRSTAPERLSQAERRSMYARVLGGSGEGATSNKEFDDLWMRFLESISAYSGARRAKDLLSDTQRAEVLARKSGRDLAVNLSLHGGGAAQFAAERLTAQIKISLSILGNKEIQAAFGSSNGTWQVIDRITRDELGYPPGSAHHRGMAQAGLSIIQFLALHAEAWADLRDLPLSASSRQAYDAVLTANDWSKLRRYARVWLQAAAALQSTTVND